MRTLSRQWVSGLLAVGLVGLLLGVMGCGGGGTRDAIVGRWGQNYGSGEPILLFEIFKDGHISTGIVEYKYRFVDDTHIHVDYGDQTWEVHASGDQLTVKMGGSPAVTLTRMKAGPAAERPTEVISIPIPNNPLGIGSPSRQSTVVPATRPPRRARGLPEHGGPGRSSDHGSGRADDGGRPDHRSRRPDHGSARPPARSSGRRRPAGRHRRQMGGERQREADAGG